MRFKKLILAAVIVALLVLAFIWLNPIQPAPVQMPNPNGYYDLVAAGQMFAGSLPICISEQLDDKCAEEVRAYLNENSEALKRLRLGLSRESRIPLVLTPTYFAQHLPELVLMKASAQALHAEGKLAESENRVDDAIQSYMDALRFQEKMRGGAMIDALVGIAIETIGTRALQKLSEKMTAGQRRTVIDQLAHSYTNRDSYAEIMINERRFFNIGSLRERLTFYATFHLRRKAERNSESKIKAAQSHTGLLMVDLGLRSFTSDKGAPPKSLQELVPNYLPFLPKDLFSKKDFVYRPSAKSYEVYGIGPDGIDDGGKPLVRKGAGESLGDMLPNGKY